MDLAARAAALRADAHAMLAAGADEETVEPLLMLAEAAEGADRALSWIERPILAFPRMRARVDRQWWLSSLRETLDERSDNNYFVRMGLDVAGFDHLLNEYFIDPWYERHPSSAGVHAPASVKPPPGPARGGRPGVGPRFALALALFYLHSRGCITTELVFATKLPASTLCENTWEALRVLYDALQDKPIAKVSWYSEESARWHAEYFRRKTGGVLKNAPVIGFADGTTFEVEDTQEPYKYRLQNAMYHGGKKKVCVNCVFVGDHCGIVRSAMVNMPGTWGDNSDIAMTHPTKGLAVKLSVLPADTCIMADTAFMVSHLPSTVEHILCPAKCTNTSSNT
jgi:hypothetical protein